MSVIVSELFQNHFTPLVVSLAKDSLNDAQNLHRGNSTVLDITSRVAFKHLVDKLICSCKNSLLLLAFVENMQVVNILKFHCFSFIG